jgi:hypothetical protein
MKRPGRLRLKRDLEAEQKMVEAILDLARYPNNGGNIYAIRAVTGRQSFRGTGEFEMLLTTGVADSSGGESRRQRAY